MTKARKVHYSLALQIDLLLNHGVKGLYGVEEKLYLRKRKGESIQHVVMKLLSYLIYYREDLKIEKAVGQRYKPDLVALDSQGEPEIWIDCGSTSLKKLEAMVRGNGGTKFIIVKAYPGELSRYVAQVSTALREEERLHFLSFGEDLVNQLGEKLTGRHEIVATLSEEGEKIYVSIDGEGLKGTLLFLS